MELSLCFVMLDGVRANDVGGVDPAVWIMMPGVDIKRRSLDITSVDL